MDSNEVRDLAKLLSHVIRLQMVTVHKRMEEQGFCRSQPGIIHVLSKHDGMTQVELATKLNVTPATISAMLKRMERDQMIERRRSQEDQRVTHVYLTEHGKQQSDGVEKIFDEMNQKGFGNFTDEELMQAKNIFQKLIDNLGDISCQGRYKGC